MTKFDTSTVALIKERLDALPARRPLRPYDLIEQLLEEIGQARSRGYGTEHLRELLQESGVVLTDNTLRNYIARARRAKAVAAQRSPSTPSPVPLHGEDPSAQPHAHSSRTAAPLPKAPSEPAVVDPAAALCARGLSQPVVAAGKQARSRQSRA